jgi:3-deoxy-D-manno-octulosonic-acid transferase
MRTPLLYRFYVGLSMVWVPFTARHAINSLRRADVPVHRAHELLAHATEPRTKGPLIWCHAASDNEALPVLALIARMGAMMPDAQFLITSRSAASAKLIAGRLPPRTVHQFAPLDAPGPVGRFLKQWHPDAALFVGAVPWPHTVRRTCDTGVPMALVDAKVSTRALGLWEKLPRLATFLLAAFDLIMTPDDAAAHAMVRMHAPPERVARAETLRSFTPPLPRDDDLIFELLATLGHRPVWIATETHEGEEKTILAAHRCLLERHPKAMLLLIPHDPERGTQVLQTIADTGLPYTRRSRGEGPRGAVHLVDTSDERGTWFALSDIVFLGGSLRPIGGHNPMDAARSGAFVMSGNHISHNAQTFAALEAAGGARIISGAADLATHVGDLFENPQFRARKVKAASTFVNGEKEKLDRIAQRLINALRLASPEMRSGRDSQP